MSRPGRGWKRNLPPAADVYNHLVLLAQDQVGYKNLVKLVHLRAFGGLLLQAAH
jgi:DNA polymerase III alpha subunit